MASRTRQSWSDRHTIHCCPFPFFQNDMRRSRRTSISSAWDPLSLAFSDGDLESHYATYLALYTFLPVDLAFARFGIFTCVVMAWGIFQGWWPRSFFVTLTVNAVCGTTIILAQGGDRRWWYLRNRTVLVLLLRTVRCAFGIYVISSLPNDMPEWSPVRLVILFAFVSFYWQVGMPLTFKVRISSHCSLVTFALCSFMCCIRPRH